jgi:hypothetical protein
MTEQEHRDTAPTPAAALVIRVWQDSAEPSGLRARITRRPDLSVDHETSTVVTSADAVYGEVRAWLELFTQRTGRGSA